MGGGTVIAQQGWAIFRLVPSSGSSRRRLTWPLLVEASQGPPAEVLMLSGRLSAPTAATLSRVVDEALTAGRLRVVLDCSGVDYISSAGIAALERAAERMTHAGGALVLCRLHESVRVSLEVSGAGSQLDWTA